MSEPDAYYDLKCKERFDGHDKKLEELDGKVDALMIIVENGLSHRVKRIDKLIWLIAAVVIGKIVVEAFI